MRIIDWSSDVCSSDLRRFGPNFNAEQARQLGLDETVLNRMVEDKLYEQAARDMGISISEKDVRDAIMNAPAFRDPAGQFNRLAFESYLRNEGYSERSEEHTSELQSLMRISYAVSCLKK